MRIALLQHLGAPCEAVCKPRSEVAVGDVLGEANAFVSAPVHASVSGVVGRSGVTTLPNGRHVPVIPVAAADEQPLTGNALVEDLYGGPWPTEDVEQYESQQIVDAVRGAGLVGLGGAAFPTHVKLTRNEQKPIDTLLLNGCECEPYLTADYRLMLEHPEPIVAGALLAQRACGAGSVVICIENNKPEAIEAIRRAADGTGAEVAVMKTKYPQGGEKQLIQAALGTRGSRRRTALGRGRGGRQRGHRRRVGPGRVSRKTVDASRDYRVGQGNRAAEEPADADRHELPGVDRSVWWTARGCRARGGRWADDGFYLG